MIFDRFPSRYEADLFARNVARRFGLNAIVFDDNAAAMEADPFPWKLDPPIVHVERSDAAGVERSVEAMVERYGGTFAGT